jgi:RecB family exonuclease
MQPGRFFRLVGPTAWPAPPERFSFSSLEELEACPRRWQYAHATWDDLPSLPQRAHPRALVGTIVHKVNERLFRALAPRGLPAVGTPAYLAGVQAAEVLPTVKAMLAEAEAEYRNHPRDPGFRVSTPPRDIANEALRLFQAQYANAQALRSQRAATPQHAEGEGLPMPALLRRRGVLAEVSVRHPALPLRGQIDLLLDDPTGTRLVDLKTGTIKPSHRDQLELYALMWWRMTDDLPQTLEIAHRQGRELFPLDRARLEAVETAAAARIAAALRVLTEAPAPPRAGSACQHCAARAFCDAYWTTQTTLRPPADNVWIDLEITVEAEPSPHGFMGRDPSGTTLHVVFDTDAALRWSPFSRGERLRILGAMTEEPRVVRLVTSSEVFRGPTEAPAAGDGERP